MKTYWGVALILGILALSWGAAAGQAPSVNPASGAQSSNEGRELFRTYCASCHGVTAVGNGPAAEAMKRRPANLTLYAVNNGGVVPVAKLRRVIDGRDVSAHGSTDMPVWGYAFRTTKEGLDEAGVKARIDAIVAYIETIQARRGN